MLRSDVLWARVLAGCAFSGDRYHPFPGALCDASMIRAVRCPIPPWNFGEVGDPQNRPFNGRDGAGEGRLANAARLRPIGWHLAWMDRRLDSSGRGATEFKGRIRAEA